MTLSAERSEDGRNIAGIVRESGSHVEVGAFVVRYVCRVMAKQVPTLATDYINKRRIPEAAPENALAHLQRGGNAFSTDFVDILVRTLAERGDDLMTRVRELARKPHAGEGAGTGEEDSHLTPLRRAAP